MDPFEQFWSIYPRKVAKGAARKAFAKALKLTTLERIICGVQQYAKHVAGRDQQYTCHASTWLSQERWDDQLDDRGGLGHAIASAIGNRLGLRRSH